MSAGGPYTFDDEDEEDTEVVLRAELDARKAAGAAGVPAVVLPAPTALPTPRRALGVRFLLLVLGGSAAAVVGVVGFSGGVWTRTDAGPTRDEPARVAVPAANDGSPTASPPSSEANPKEAPTADVAAPVDGAPTVEASAIVADSPTADGPPPEAPKSTGERASAATSSPKAASAASPVAGDAAEAGRGTVMPRPTFTGTTAPQPPPTRPAPSAAKAPAPPAASTATPNFVGTWTGKYSERALTLTVASQNGGTFAGVAEMKQPDGKVETVMLNGRIEANGSLSITAGDVQFMGKLADGRASGWVQIGYADPAPWFARR